MRGGHALRPSKACDLDKVIITKCGPFDYAKAETHVPYRAKLCRAKFSSGETIRRAKFSSLNEKFVTFARRKVSPNKSKSVLK